MPLKYEVDTKQIGDDLKHSDHGEPPACCGRSLFAFSLGRKEKGGKCMGLAYRPLRQAPLTGMPMHSSVLGPLDLVVN